MSALNLLLQYGTNSRFLDQTQYNAEFWLYDPPAWWHGYPEWQSNCFIKRLEFWMAYPGLDMPKSEAVEHNRYQVRPRFDAGKHSVINHVQKIVQARKSQGSNRSATKMTVALESRQVVPHYFTHCFVLLSWSFTFVTIRQTYCRSVWSSKITIRRGRANRSYCLIDLMNYDRCIRHKMQHAFSRAGTASWQNGAGINLIDKIQTSCSMCGCHSLCYPTVNLYNAWRNFILFVPAIVIRKQETLIRKA